MIQKKKRWLFIIKITLILILLGFTTNDINAETIYLNSSDSPFTSIQLKMSNHMVDDIGDISFDLTWDVAGLDMWILQSLTAWDSDAPMWGNEWGDSATFHIPKSGEWYRPTPINMIYVPNQTVEGFIFKSTIPDEDDMPSMVDSWSWFHLSVTIHFDQDGFPESFDMLIGELGFDHEMIFQEEPWPETNDTISLDYFRLGEEITYLDPRVILSEDVTYAVGTPTTFLEHILATWGYSTWLHIPDNGIIEITSLIDGNDPVLSTDGVIFDRIGASMHDYIIRDSHSLDTDNPLYEHDNTFAETSRKISVCTDELPQLWVHYGFGADFGLYNTPYLISNEMPCGGRNGWTNQPLDFRVNAGTIVGSFDTALRIHTFWPQDVVATNAPVVETNYRTSSVGESGTEITGFLAEIDDISNVLSGEASRTIRIDTQAPIPGATYDEDFVFTDESYDTLSGLRDGESTIAIFASSEGVTNPPLSAFTSFEEVDITADGEYDVWVRAIDNAGNVGIRRVFVGLDITGVGRWGGIC